MFRSMVGIQSATAEIRKAKKIDRRKIEETTGQKYNVLPITLVLAAISNAFCITEYKAWG